MVRTIGTESYGIPVVPEDNRLRDTPRNFLIQLWPLLESHITVFDKAPDALCAAMGVAAQDVIIQAKDAINPELAAQIVMQSAFATSSSHPLRPDLKRAGGFKTDMRSVFWMT